MSGSPQTSAESKVDRYSDSTDDDSLTKISNSLKQLIPDVDAANEIEEEADKNIANIETDLLKESVKDINKIIQQRETIEKTEVLGMIENLEKKRKELINFTNSSRYVRQADKIYYIIGCLCTFFTFYLLGSSPGKYFFYWVVFIEIVCYVKRLILYYSYGWHFFLIDFCYFCNAGLCLLLMCYPHSKTYYYAIYISGTGCLANAIMVFRNSMIYHHFDKLCDLTIHLQ